jgi:hypothetical protein
MNSLKNKLAFFSVVMITAFSFACSSAKETGETLSQDDLIQAINNNRWTFTANNASPSYGGSRNLTGGFFITLKTDTLVSALPYYGKLNSPSGALEGNPLDFRSTNFTLKKEDKKAGEWIVTIDRPDKEVQAMTFTLFDNGSAQLSVIMTNRTGISFSGRVAPANSR